MRNIFTILIILVLMVSGELLAQPWTYDFGTGTGSYSTSNTASTSFLPTPASGTSRVRVSNEQGGSFNLENSGTGIQKIGSNSRLRIVAPIGGSVGKFSIYDYTAGKSFYTKFSILLGDNDGANVNSGSWLFFQGDGSTYSDNSSFIGAQVFTGLRFNFGTGGAITSDYRNGSSWTSLESSPVSQGNVYTFEIFGNNTTSTIDYTYNGNSQSVASNKQDIWINGSLVGNDLNKAGLANDVNIDSWMFYGESSTSNVANIFIDDITYSNSIASTYTSNLNLFSKASGTINTLSNWTTNNDGTGTVNPSNFTSSYINYNIRNNSSPTIGADWTVSGTGSKIVVGDGTNACTFDLDYNLTVPNLDISSNGTLVLKSGKQATVSGTLSNSGTLTIKSDASGTGSLIHSSSGVSATVERYVAGHGNAAAEGWHLMGSPVATFNITGSSFQPGTNDDLYAWSESTNTWLNYKAGNPTQIVPGTGYLLAYENTGTKSFSGALHVSDVSVSGLAHNASQGKGWHLLGNPFASALEWNKTGGSWTLTNIAGTAKIWNSTSKTYTDITANGIIPSAQGFFVQVAESTTGSLTIPSAARAHSATGWYKNTTPRIQLSASPADGSSRQESQIRLEPEATSGFDFYWDSRFLEGYAPKFYSIMGNEKLSTNAMPVLPNGTSIPFGFEKNQHSSYVIRLEESLPGETIFLKDLKLNTVHNLSQNPEYLFSAVQGDDPNRFLLVFGTVGVDEKPAAQAQLQAYMANGLLWVNNPAENSQLAVFDLSGRLLMQQQLRGKGLQQLSLNLQKGAYILRLTEGNSSLSTKVINQ